MSRKILAVLALSTLAIVSCRKERYMDEPGNLLPKTVMEDPSLPAIEVNGAKLHAQAFGPADSTLIICIHGGPGANYQYLLNCVSLADSGYRVVFYDQRGSGLSQRFSSQWYVDKGAAALDKSYYDDLKAVIAYYKTHSEQKVVLLTQSWGSIMGTAFAGKYPNEIDGLISAEPGGLKWNDIIDYVGRSRSFSLWTEVLNDATYLDQFITGKENDHEVLDYKMVQISSENAIVGDYGSDLGPNKKYYPSVRDGAVIASVMFEIGSKYTPDFSAGISNFQKKVLFFYSEKNQAFPDSWAQKIAAVYPVKEIVKVPGVGHSGMFDQLTTWKNFTEPRVLEYLRNL